MRTIWKFPIAIGAVTKIEVPAIAPIRMAGLDPATGEPAIWVELDTDAPRVERRFVVHGTGHEIPGTDGGYPQPIHVGSLIQGPFVWHIFEERN